MDDDFKIFLEQLHAGEVKAIHARCPASMLEVDEEILHFEGDVIVDGDAYTAGDELLIHFDAKASAVMPCKICSAPVQIQVKVEDFYHAEPVADIKGSCFDYRELLRETILLEVPLLAECKSGNCPERQQIAKYLKEPKSSNDEGYQPFADINLDQFKP